MTPGQTPSAAEAGNDGVNERVATTGGHQA